MVKSKLTNVSETMLITLWAKAEELGIDFKGNDELENSIKKAMGIKTESEETK